MENTRVDHLEKSALSLVGWFKVLSRFRLVPYSWDRKKKEAVYRQDLGYKLCIYANLTLLLLYSLFNGIQTYRGIGNAEWSASAKSRSYFILGFCVCAIFGNVASLEHSDEYWSFMQQLFKLKGLLGESPKSNVSVHSKTLMWVIRSMRYLVLFGTWTNPLGIFKTPSQPALITSLLSNPERLSPGAKIALYSIQYLMIHATLSPYTFFMALNIYYCHLLKHLFEKLSYSRPQSGNSCDGKQFEPIQVKKLHSQLLVIEIAARKCLGIWASLEILLGAYALITSIFMAICFRQARMAIFALTLFQLYTYLVKKGGDVYTTSEQVLRSWSSNFDQPLWFHKYRVACKSSRVSVSSWFYLDKGFLLTFLNIVLTNTISLILYHNDG